MSEAPLYIRCLCGVNKYPINASLPIKAHICHCTTCRISNGTLFSENADVDSAPFDVSSPPATITKYTAPNGGAGYFCNKCGSMMVGSYSWTTKDGEIKYGYCISTGCLYLSDIPENNDKKLEDVVKIDFHCFIGGGVDGGSALWVGDWDRTDLPRTLGHPMKPEKLSKDNVGKMMSEATYSNDDKQIDAQCLCKSVKMRYFRDTPDWKSKTCICVCNSCRLFGGVDMIAWSGFPRDKSFLVGENDELIAWPDVWDKEAKAKFPNLVVYESSQEKLWGSCSKCGASAFFQYEALIDGKKTVQCCTGLFGWDDKKGIRHEDWLAWDAFDNFDFMEYAEGEGRAGIISREANRRFMEWKKSVSA